MSHNSNIPHRQPAALLIQPALSRHGPRVRHAGRRRPWVCSFPGSGMSGNGPSARVDRKHNGAQPVAGVPLSSGATGTYLERPMMQNLDLLDWCLLAGSVVYFGLLVLRRI